MGGTGATRRTARGASKIHLLRTAACALAVGIGTGCALMPGELNLSPIYRHRLDGDGSVRELDFLWPIFHYRKAEQEGGWEFRIRPLYRYVEEPPAEESTYHEFLWPLGRVHHSRGETLSRLFPLFRYKSRLNEKGQRETDWYATLLVWGGSSEDGTEDYLAVLPFYADIPDFLTYDRFQTHLFPLHVRLTKGDSTSNQFLWPLIGFGGNESGSKYWHRVLPFYGVNVDEEKYERYTALWPLFHWGTENLDTDDPVSRFFFFPFIGWQNSVKVDGWTFLWPFFQKISIAGRSFKLDLLWPIFRYFYDTQAEDIEQWWVWPFVGHTVTEDQDTWSWLWPLIWWSHYEDPDATQDQHWVLPFYWRVHQDFPDGTEDHLTKLWPLFHTERYPDGGGHYQVLSPWLWRRSYAAGAHELYGWLWTLAEGRYTADSSNFDLAAHIFTTAKRDDRRQTSVPFLFNYESDRDGSTLRLFQFLPIPLGGGSQSPEPR